MSTNQIVIWAIVAVIILGGGYFLFSSPEDQAMMKDDTTSMEKDLPAQAGDAMTDEGDTMMKDEGAMMEKGTYESYSPEKLALANDGKVVLYFHADWCPICRPLDAEFSSASLPSDVHILKVDYDTAAALKQKYGVTYQHTFVQVDAQGNLVAKWGDALTLAQVLARVQ